MPTKVMKYQVIYMDGCGDFKNAQKELWDIQRQTRTILNRTVQILYDWDFKNQKHHEETGEYLDIVEKTGYKRIDGHVYNELKSTYSNMSANNMNTSIQKAWKKYKDARTEILKGNMSVPSYRKDQPLDICAKNIKAEYDKGIGIVTISIFSKNYTKEKEYGRVRFKVCICDGSQDSIFTRVLSGEYKIGNCQIVYRKSKWFLYLTYTFEKTDKPDLDADKILGIDLGEKFAVCGSIYGDRPQKALMIDGGEVTAFANRIEARIKSMQRSSVHSGTGRSGHGTKTKVKNIYSLKDKVARFRDTKNHTYSHAVIKYAVDNNCGVIQMEDLSGIKENLDFPMILRHWTYYDLQSKIETKAKENGIIVKKINPYYTSQRCSKCGYIDSDNRKEQANFKCQKCGFTANADWNASQNISIKDIDLIISNETGKESVG